MNFDPTALPDLIGRFHPLLLHFPIGLLAWAAMVELICIYRKRGVPEDGPESLPFVVPGAAFAILASVTGWLLADPNDPDTALAWHRWLGVSTSLLAILTCGVGIAASRGSSVAGSSYRLALFLCVPTLMGAGHLGGELKWGDGFVEKGFEKVFFSERASGEDPVVPAEREVVAKADSGGAQAEVASADVSIPAELAAEELFHDKVKPLLDKHCVSCHGPEKAKGKLRLDRPDDLRDLSRDFPLVVAGDPQQSLLLELVLLDADDDDRMPPPEEEGLSNEEIQVLETWVTAGAPWPGEGPKGPVGLPGPLHSAEVILAKDDHEEEEVSPAEEGDEESKLSPEEHFQQVIEPLLMSRCVECHGVAKQKGNLRLDIPEAVFADREFPTIVKGSPEESELMLRINLPDDDDERMPPMGERLTEAESQAFKKWISDGAPWPEKKIEVPQVPAEEKDSAETKSKPDSVVPGQFPEFPRIMLEDPEAKTAISEAVEALTALGVRVGPISRQEMAHEAIFRLLGDRIGDTELRKLGGLEPVLTRLDLARTAVTGASISQLWKFRRLRVVNLSETAFTDDDLATLASLPDLTVLNLFGTHVTDAGLDILKQMKSLRRVYLWRTQVTPSGAARLADSRPDLLVDIGVTVEKNSKEEIEKE